MSKIGLWRPVKFTDINSSSLLRMATLKTLEIDTLKLRSLQITTSNNVYIPADFQLYSKGDGTTYWSTGVTAIQFIKLSTAVSSFEYSTLLALSSLRSELYSTLFGFSTFAFNLSTYEICLKYTDLKVSELSTNLVSYIANSYATKGSVSILSTLISSNYTTLNKKIESGLSSLSTIIDKIEFNYENLSTLLQSTAIDSITQNTESTLLALFAYDSTNKYKFQKALVNNTVYLENEQMNLSTAIGLRINVTEDKGLIQSTQVQSTLITLPKLISTIIGPINLSTMSYLDKRLDNTNMKYSEVSTFNTKQDIKISTIASTLTSSINSNYAHFTTVISTLVSTQSSTNSYMINNVNSLIQKGITSQIFQTFTDLEKYSAKTVNDSVNSINTQFSTTLSSYTGFTYSSISGVNKSTYTFFSNNIYFSTLSTVMPIVSTSLVSSLRNIITQFSTTVKNLNSTNIGVVSSYLNNNNASTVLIVNAAISTFSTSFHSQYLTAPSIIMNSFNNISTLQNIYAPDGITKLKVGIINLDLTKSNNFYMLVSDISSDVFYGLTYSTTSEQLSKDISLQIDITSSYTNNYNTIDTTSLSNWLGLPKIYNQGPTSFLERESPQIYLSTFIGSQIVNMRLNMNKLYIKDIITIPYIYTMMALYHIEVETNMSVSDPRLLNSTFVYSGSIMPVNWNTNDLNVEVGIKFEGKDINGNRIERWAGPYNSADKVANVIVPECFPLAQYTTINIGLYPPKGYMRAPTSGNINSETQMFDTVVLEKPIHVFTPTINSKITIYNPGNVEKILEISELQIINKNGENIVGTDTTKYARVITNGSRPFQGDYLAWKITNMFDGSSTTAYRGGRDVNRIDKTAYVSVDMQANADTTLDNQILSSISIIGSQKNDSLFSIEGMIMKIENRYVPGIADGLFFKEVTLNTYTPNVISLR